ncbi:MAG: hydrogenase maturation protease [Acidobacteria bacterium]|nr:hydrogenase maturation protease [Acidobacteriota bacterium]
MVIDTGGLREVLTTAHRKGDKVLVVGIGNELRGDDGIGCLVARDVAQAKLEGLDGLDAGIAIENASVTIRTAGAGLVLMVDAVRIDSIPTGSWSLHPVDALDSFCHTTHSVPLSLIISALAESMPKTSFHFLGINIGPTSDFAPLSEPVKKARTELFSLFQSIWPQPPNTAEQKKPQVIND